MKSLGPKLSFDADRKRCNWLGFLQSFDSTMTESIEVNPSASVLLNDGLTVIRFNKDQVEAVFKRASDLVAERDIFKFAKVTKDESGNSTLEICGLWRIDKATTGKIECSAYDLVGASWERVDSFERWPPVPLIPLQKARHLGWWNTIVRLALSKILNAAGDGVWVELKKGVLVPSKDAPFRIADRFLSQYLPEESFSFLRGDESYVARSVVQLDPVKMRAEAKELRSAIFAHVGDRDISSAVLAIGKFISVALTDYLPYAVNQEHVLRVSLENRNLLPLLPRIAMRYWSRKDLFSRKLWVRGNRTRTTVDFKSFAQPLPGFSPKFQSFPSQSSFRWLLSAPFTVVGVWADSKNTTTLENIARANIQQKVPAIVWCHLLRQSCGYRSVQAGVGPVMQIIFRTFVGRAAEVWKEDGFNALKQWLPHQEFGAVLDWLDAEGRAQGFPNKRCTWESLTRRSNVWHMRQRLEMFDSSYELKWASAIQTTLIDGVLFKPLTTSKEVAIDAFNLHHCAAQYASICAKGNYRLFSVMEPNTIYSTLGLHLVGGVWRVEQHRGKFNAAVSSMASAAGHKLAEIYQAAVSRDL